MNLKKDILFHDRYRLVKELGRGAFGEVWMAHDETSDIDVALKVYVAMDENGLEEFRNEFRLVHEMNHTNILRPDYFSECEHRPYLVMQLCTGSVVSEMGKMDESAIWQMIKDVASGLAYLHSKNIVHRDIKPDNILQTQLGDYVISDFGVSTKLQSTMRRNSTRKQQDVDVAGTIGYMAPELFSSKPIAVKATDIWALGATLYEIVSRGEMAFLGRGGILQVNGAAIPNMDEYCSKDLAKLITQCLSLETWDRPTAEKLVEIATRKLKGEDVISVSIDNNEQKNKVKWNEKIDNGSSKKRLMIGIVVGLILAFVVAIFVLRYGNRSESIGEIVSEYDEIGEYKEGLAWIKKDGKYGFVDQQKRLIVPIKYEVVDDFYEGLAWVILDSKWGFVDNHGTIVIPIKYDQVYNFSEGLARVQLNGKWGYIDKQGNVVIAIKYDMVYPFIDGLASVQLNGKCGFIDKYGNEKIPIKYDYVSRSSEGLSMVQLNDKYGFIDEYGKEVIPIKYDQAYNFSEGLSMVQLNDKWGFIDKHGAAAIPIEYDFALNFSNGKAFVKQNGEWFYINKRGNRVN